MIVLPAIDILDGKPVRLYQGDYGQSKCVAEDVLACAKKFEKEKANYLHVVDLNGAKEGSRINADLICEVVKTCQLPVEVGGGIRTMEAIEPDALLAYAVSCGSRTPAVLVICRTPDGNGWQAGLFQPEI